MSIPLSVQSHFFQLSYQPDIRISAYKLTFTGCVLEAHNMVNVTEHQAAQMSGNALQVNKYAYNLVRTSHSLASYWI